MDSDFWTSRLAAAKRQYTLQHHHQSSHLDRLNIDDFEVEDDVRPDFPCPYCYEDFDITSLCSHLEDEHSCESRVAVCPICSVKMAQDMLSHIQLQHGHLFKISLKMKKSIFCFPCQFINKIKLASKFSLTGDYLQRRRRLRRVAIPNSQALSLLGRDLREAHLQMLLGGSGYRSNNSNVSNAATDPFLSSLILNFPASEADEISKSVITSVEDTPAKSAAPTNMWRSSFDACLSFEEREKRMRQAAGRAGFVRDLLLSTLLRD